MVRPPALCIHPRPAARPEDRARLSTTSTRVRDVSSFLGKRSIYAGRKIAQLVERGADPASRLKRWHTNGPGADVSNPPLPLWINFPVRQIFPCLPLPNQRKFIAANQHFCR